MRKLLGHLRPRGHCELSVSREGLSIRCAGASRKHASALLERPLTMFGGETPDALAAQIAIALDEAGASGLPVHATLGDDLARYFIVTPPANGASMQDLRAAVSVRFDMLYGESGASWHWVADWRAGEPFLACAVPRHVLTALELAVTPGRGSLLSVMPEFIRAWNRSRRQLGADVWLATLDGRRLTLGLIAPGRTPRLASVRTLVLPEPAPPLAWLREHVSRAALLDDMRAPSVLLVHGALIEAWQTGADATAASGMIVKGYASRHVAKARRARGLSLAARLRWGGLSS